MPSNADIVRDYHERVWVRDDLTAIDEYWSPEASVAVTGFESSTLDAIRADVARYRGAFTDVEAHILNLIAEGDKVALHWRTSGRHVGPYGSVAATGRVITMEGMDIFRVEGGLIVDCQSLWDGLSVYEQLGVLQYPE
ncbi:putative ester cyclase [Microbacteriaceae bacterium SG_E_30_P1]|uniref:Ester cyclase n=1 Tax=Antiquaquibacter oligotrophicus TaxID=2880260 RepID=A0ABT6KNK6_9MICO|nr:ester cyclase [Antiquaquibacter oligotrophicus]MDH6181580.1 putative ester cyclase [Antiquaquibacter oligotrophicus]UDF12734.1 ester cyclase [Antiquaquibacter oligotrophicus]